MQTFFYAVTQSHCFTGCCWQVCPQRYLSRLQGTVGLQELRTFFGEQSLLPPPSGVGPKNGDIIIFYVANAGELEEIIGKKDDFDGLKKILVVADSDGFSSALYHRLTPRYITLAGRDVDELAAVIHKMKGNIQ
jgi:hypothetical protein